MIETLAAAAALLLAASGAAKLRRPVPAAALVLRLLRRPAGTRRRAARWAVRVVGAGEMAIGAAVLVTGSRPALALLAAAYLAFTAVALAVLRAGASAGDRIPCGCFGNADSPLGPAHVVLDVVAGLAALAAVIQPPGAGVGLLDGGLTTAVTGSMQASLLAALGYLAVTSLPALLAARRALTALPRPQES